MKNLKKNILLFFLIFLSVSKLFASDFHQISYKEIIKIAKETNQKLYGKYKALNNVLIIDTKNIVNKKKKISNSHITISKNNNHINVKISNSKTKTIIVIKNPDNKTNKLNIIEAPYLSFNTVVKNIIGSKNDINDALCEANIQGKDIIDTCKNIKKFIQTRNRLLDEFLSNLFKFKQDMHKNRTYYNGYFNCGLLYKYYSYKHYNDCLKLMNMLSTKEKKQLDKYINKFLQN